MIDEIFTAAGLSGRYRETRMQAPVRGNYAVYTDDVTADGPDGYNLVFTHDITVELYEPKPDDQVEADFESALDAFGLHWTKQARYWIREEQRYQTIYEFSYITKRRS